MALSMKTIFSALLFTLMLQLSAPVYANNAKISKQQAVRQAQQISPGRVLSVKLKGSVYQVKTLSSQGDVRIISIDAYGGKKSGK